MLKTYTVVAYGIGKCFYSYMERLDLCVCVSCFADSTNKDVGKRILGDERICINFQDIYDLDNPWVIITTDDENAVKAIKEMFEKRKIPCCHARDILGKYTYADAAPCIQWPKEIQKDRIHRFIDINVNGTTMCNLHCEYCYVWRKEEFKAGTVLSKEHGIEEMRSGLSKDRLGGSCFMNLCARGETLLAQDIVKLIFGLLEEGHFVSVVTNGTVTSRIEEILAFPQEYLDRMFFKISFHYRELARLKLMEKFWDNVNRIRKTNASYTLEITPGDETIPLIPEIKEMSLLKTDGMLPHVSFTRDSNKVGYDLLSEHSIEEYRRIWGQFDSKMFDLKSRWYGKNMRKYQCYGGNWSYLVDLNSGIIKPCYRADVMGNIYDKTMKAFPVLPIDHQCRVAYCFNNHAFLAWGCVPQISCDTYLAMRNRENEKGEAWVKPVMEKAMTQKLQDNNYLHIGRWDDYGKLYKPKRRKAIVIFNSPDYPNLGDHAIALGERMFLSCYFPQYDVIEISSEEYMKENLRIKGGIRRDDIIAVTGGGNIGTLWIRLNDLVCHIISSYEENPMVIFPQTIFYENSDYGCQEKRFLRQALKKHKNMIFAVRDGASLNRLHEIIGDEITKVLVPDMAFFLKSKYTSVSMMREPLMLVCMRNDREKRKMVHGDFGRLAQKLNLTLDYVSTIASQEVTMNNRESYLDEIMSRLASAKVVITDRLHCMIFCWLTGTPCVVFDNVSGKLHGVKEWLTDSTFIGQCRGNEDILECVKKVMENQGKDSCQSWIAIEQGFEKLAGLIRKAGETE